MDEGELAYALAGGHGQAQRRPGHEHGAVRSEVGAGGPGRPVLPRRGGPADPGAARAEYGVQLPLILMNSFRTRDESLAVLGRYPDLAVDGLPLDFLQSAEPKLRADDLSPVDWPADPELEWCPPGHGDVYLSLAATGLLDALLDKGFRYVFLSNADNLGATCDPRDSGLAGARTTCPTCRRSASGRPTTARVVTSPCARATASWCCARARWCRKQDEEAFQDIARHTLFHANSLWVDLHALDALLRRAATGARPASGCR